MLSDHELALELREAIRPLIRRLNNKRTLSLGKSGVLARLSERGRATAAELAAAEQISPQAITSAVRELESLNLVERHTDDVDRRKIWVQLTDDGHRRLDTDREAGQRWLSETLSTRLDTDERAALRAAIPVLRKLSAEPTDD